MGEQLTLDNTPSIEDMKAGITRIASFSECGQYRYTLARIWDGMKPSILFVLLNPSTADAQQDDPTNRKCMYWAMRNGYGMLTFCNLFAWRSPYPKVMKAQPEPIGPANDEVIHEMIKSHKVVVAGWGNDGGHMGRDKVVLGFHDSWMCVGTNKGGQPSHPLYMKNATELMRFPVDSSGDGR